MEIFLLSFLRGISIISYLNNNKTINNGGSVKCTGLKYKENVNIMIKIKQLSRNLRKSNSTKNH